MELKSFKNYEIIIGVSILAPIATTGVFDDATEAVLKKALEEFKKMK